MRARGEAEGASGLRASSSLDSADSTAAQLLAEPGMAQLAQVRVSGGAPPGAVAAAAHSRC